MRAATLALDALLGADEDDPVAQVGRLPRVPPARQPFVPLPKRKTHGGGFGPAVVAKLRQEALR